MGNVRAHRTVLVVGESILALDRVILVTLAIGGGER